MAATGVDQLSGPLAQIVGEENVLTGANVARFSRDALGAARGSPQVAPVPAADVVVVRPGETQEVAAVVRIANERGIAIVPRGGGSGLMGGALPLTRSIVIDTTRMDRVLDVSRDDQTMLVQSGAVLGEVNRHLEPHSLVLGHDPWTVNVATVGGTISTDSLGYLGAKYGSMGDQVLGLTVVLPDGSLLETGAVAKASVGPDLRRLFIAAEGCFGVITEARLRVFPIPEERLLLAFQFASFGDGLAAILAMRTCGLAPDILEFDEEFGDDGESELGPLYLGFEGYRESVRAAAERARSVCVASGGRELPESEGGRLLGASPRYRRPVRGAAASRADSALAAAGQRVRLRAPGDACLSRAGVPRALPGDPACSPCATGGGRRLVPSGAVLRLRFVSRWARGRRSPGGGGGRDAAAGAGDGRRDGVLPRCGRPAGASDVARTRRQPGRLALDQVRAGPEGNHEPRQAGAVVGSAGA